MLVSDEHAQVCSDMKSKTYARGFPNKHQSLKTTVLYEPTK